MKKILKYIFVVALSIVFTPFILNAEMTQETDTSTSTDRVCHYSNVRAYLQTHDTSNFKNGTIKSDGFYVDGTEYFFNVDVNIGESTTRVEITPASSDFPKNVLVKYYNSSKMEYLNYGEKATRVYESSDNFGYDSKHYKYDPLFKMFVKNFDSEEFEENNDIDRNLYHWLVCPSYIKIMYDKDSQTKHGTKNDFYSLPTEDHVTELYFYVDYNNLKKYEENQAKKAKYTHYDLVGNTGLALNNYHDYDIHLHLFSYSSGKLEIYLNDSSSEKCELGTDSNPCKSPSESVLWETKDYTTGGKKIKILSSEYDAFKDAFSYNESGVAESSASINICLKSDVLLTLDTCPKGYKLVSILNVDRDVALKGLSTKIGDYDPSSDTCRGLLGDKLVEYVQIAYTAIKIVSIVIYIVLAMLDFTQVVTSNKKDELLNTAKKWGFRAIILIAILLLPTLIDTIGNAFGYKDIACGIK